MDTPLIDELAMAVECRLISYNPETCRLVDERVLTDDGRVDVSKLAPIVFDPINSAYHKLDEKVGSAFQDGLKLK